MCHTERVAAIAAPSLAEALALVAADPSLVGHPVVAGLLVAVEHELIERLRVLEARVAAQDEELAELRRQLGQHSGNSGQPGHAGTTRRRPTCATPSTCRRRGCGSCTGCRCRRPRSRPSASRADARQQAQALAVPVACMDETGLRVAGATRWLHVLGDETVTAYHLGARGDIREGYAGTVVHDRFAAYWNAALTDETVHALCHAHLLRNLEEIVELEEAPDGWAARRQRWLLAARCRPPCAWPSRG